MALLFEDFKAAIEAKFAAHPALAMAYNAGDPRLLGQILAQATMASMISAQLDVAEVEPFVKARDGTVLADASLKGILPLARSAAVTLRATNNNIAPVVIGTGRIILDSKGHKYRINSGVTVPAGGTVDLSATQGTVRSATHTVAGAKPFYEVQVPPSASGMHLVGLEITADALPYLYIEEFSNVSPDDHVYLVETDEYRRLWVRFGAADAVHGNVVGHQVENGDTIQMDITECDGKIDLSAGEPFTLENIVSLAENDVSMSLLSVDSTGADPITIEEMRMLSKYPALYDSNAVHLGNFDFLLRKKLPGFEFLGVWNEQIEESVRPPSVININKLFVAFIMPSMSVLAAQTAIKQVISRADDSLKVIFVSVHFVAVPVTVTAEVGIIHDVAVVQSQIEAILVSEYGPGSINASRGLSKVFRVQEIHELLKARIPALQDQLSDFNVAIGAIASPLPEDYRYISSASLTVAVTNVQHNVGLWSH